MTKIEWTEETWNPVTGCTKISHGCKNCYAERMAKRLQAMGPELQPKYANGFEVTLHHALLALPYKWKKPRTVFVNSMSDLFHPKVPDYFILDVFGTMKDNPHHTFQVLTKRPERLYDLSDDLKWNPNIWIGVSIESQIYEHRIDYLITSGEWNTIRFLSCEPLLRPLDLSPWLKDLDWIIVGGESGPKARPIKEEWVLSIQKQCRLSNVPFFFKQWGGVNKKKTGRLLQGQEFNEMPVLA